MRVKNGKSSEIMLVSCISFGKLNLFFRLTSRYSQEKKRGKEKPTSAFVLVFLFKYLGLSMKMVLKGYA